LEGVEWGKRLTEILEKYKYALAVVLIGMVLMMLPGHNSTQSSQTQDESIQEDDLEQSLETILSQIQGAGRVQVLLSVQAGEENHYQTDCDESTGSENSTQRKQTVLVSDSQRSEAGLIRRTDPPKYLGAIIVCTGADNARVKLAIVQAVSCVTGLSANQISVLKTN